MSIKIGKICCVLTDGENSTEKIMMKSYLAPVDDMPIILGFADLLEHFEVSFNYVKRIASLAGA